MAHDQEGRRHRLQESPPANLSHRDRGGWSARPTRAPRFPRTAPSPTRRGAAALPTWSRPVVPSLRHRYRRLSQIDGPLPRRDSRPAPRIRSRGPQSDRSVDRAPHPLSAPSSGGSVRFAAAGPRCPAPPAPSPTRWPAGGRARGAQLPVRGSQCAPNGPRPPLPDPTAPRGSAAGSSCPRRSGRPSRPCPRDGAQRWRRKRECGCRPRLRGP